MKLDNFTIRFIFEGDRRKKRNGGESDVEQTGAIQGVNNPSG